MEITINDILLYVVAAAPSLVAILSTITVALKMFKELKKTKEELKDDEDISTIKSQNRMILDENYALKKQINRLIDKIDKIRTSSNESVDTNKKSKTKV